MQMWQKLLYNDWSLEIPDQMILPPQVSMIWWMNNYINFVLMVIKAAKTLKSHGPSSLVCELLNKALLSLPVWFYRVPFFLSLNIYLFQCLKVGKKVNLIIIICRGTYSLSPCWSITTNQDNSSSSFIRVCYSLKWFMVK